MHPIPVGRMQRREGISCLTRFLAQSCDRRITADPAHADHTNTIPGFGGPARKATTGATCPLRHPRLGKHRSRSRFPGAPLDGAVAGRSGALAQARGRMDFDHRPSGTIHRALELQLDPKKYSSLVPSGRCSGGRHQEQEPHFPGAAAGLAETFAPAQYEYSVRQGSHRDLAASGT